MDSAPSTIVWTERTVINAATHMLMTERQAPAVVADFLSRMAIRLPGS